VTDTGELAEMAPVGRELMLLPRDQQRLNVEAAGSDGGRGKTRPWIDNLPANFNGRLTMHTPEYLVEVSDRIDENDAEVSSSKFGEKTMVPLTIGIRLQARDSDYACVTHCQRRLNELLNMPASRLPRIVRIVEWDEVSESVHHTCTLSTLITYADDSRESKAFAGERVWEVKEYPILLECGIFSDFWKFRCEMVHLRLGPFKPFEP